MPRLASAILLLLAQPALACGGLFCGQIPVDQSGEIIVFGVNQQAGEVSMHVQISFAGAAEDFAWVLPVEGTPDLFLSHSILFQALDALLWPSFDVARDLSACSSDEGDADTDTDTDADTALWDTADTGSGSGGVTVLAEVRVGAYDTQTVAANDANVLVQWLQDNNYDVPSDLASVLEPYIAADMNFVAMRLTKGAVMGDLAPLGLRYHSKYAGIPLRLTSVAATPDMPLRVYLFGESRGVPLNYRHMQLNPLAIDYWRNGRNRRQVVSKAADEAGGQAFVTDYSGPTSIGFALWTPSMFDADGLRAFTEPAAFVAALPAYGFQGTPEVMNVLQAYVPVPADFPNSPANFYSCPSCYPNWYSQVAFDVTRAVDALVAREVEPRRAAQALFDSYPKLTRLSTVMSDYEMTVDPIFGFNPDLPDVKLRRRLTVKSLCHARNRSYPSSLRRLDYPLDESIIIPSPEAMGEGLAFDWVQPYVTRNALVIERMMEAGPPDVIEDYRGQLPEGAVFEDGPAWPAQRSAEDEGGTSSGGCGCQQGRGAPLWALLPLIALFRRRSAGAPPVR